MDHATSNTSLNTWARTYMFQLYIKNYEVERVVFSAAGALAGTSSTSYGYDTVDRVKILAVNKAMVCEWGSYKTASDFVKKFLFKNINSKTFCTSNIGKALLKQLDLVSPFSCAMEKEFKKDKNFKSITSALKGFLKSTGAGVSSIDTMKSWLELMSITGILHGNTYSLNRLSNTHSMVSMNTYESSTFTLRDVTYMTVLFATVMGTFEEFYTFSDHLPAYNLNPSGINKVLQKYDQKTAALKSQYQEEITEDAVLYSKYGWILSDHGPNFKDGKQLSHITYF